MDVPEAVTQIRDAITVKRVFGDPYERDGDRVDPGRACGRRWWRRRRRGIGAVAIQRQPARKSGSGFGLGFGLGATPVGAYVIEGGDVRWKPALDVTNIVLRAQAGCDRSSC